MIAIERERQAGAEGRALGERIAKVSPETLRAIEMLVVHDERVRALAAVDGRA